MSEKLQKLLPAAEELPPPSAEMILLRVFVEALLECCKVPRKRRARVFIDTAASILANEESLSLIVPIRPTTQMAEVNRARRQALAIFRAYAPTFLARLPPGAI